MSLWRCGRMKSWVAHAKDPRATLMVVVGKTGINNEVVMSK